MDRLGNLKTERTMGSMNDPFFIVAAAMFTFGLVFFVLGRIERRAVRAAADNALTMAYREGLIRGRSEGHQARRQMEKCTRPENHGGKEQGHD